MPVKQALEDLEFLCEAIWNFHGNPKLTPQNIQAATDRLRSYIEIDDGPELPLKEKMRWKRPLIEKAFHEGLSARACARVFDVSHEMAATVVKKIDRQPEAKP